MASQFYDDMLSPAGLRGTQFYILSIINEKVSMSTVEIASRLELDLSTMSKNVRFDGAGRFDRDPCRPSRREEQGNWADDERDIGPCSGRAALGGGTRPIRPGKRGG
jgi:hypothetical protein